MPETSDRLRARLTVLRSVSRALARPHDLRGVVRAVYEAMGGALDVTICFFGLYDATSQSVEVVWQVHNGAELPGGHFPLGSGPSSQAIRESRAQLLRDWNSRGPRPQVQYATDRPGLPESAIFAPVVFDAEVIGVLAFQSYARDAYEEDDVALVQSVADLMAVAIAATRRVADVESPVRAEDLEAILASMSDALLVLDSEGCLVRLNTAGRELLAKHTGGAIFGQPVEPLKPILEQLKREHARQQDTQVALNGDAVACRASLLRKEGETVGAVMVLRELPRRRR